MLAWLWQLRVFLERWMEEAACRLGSLEEHHLSGIWLYRRQSKGRAQTFFWEGVRQEMPEVRIQGLVLTRQATFPFSFGYF
jgi:hypothetical protein